MYGLEKSSSRSKSPKRSGMLSGIYDILGERRADTVKRENAIEPDRVLMNGKRVYAFPEVAEDMWRDILPEKVRKNRRVVSMSSLNKEEKIERAYRKIHRVIEKYAEEQGWAYYLYRGRYYMPVSEWKKVRDFITSQHGKGKAGRR